MQATLLDEGVELMLAGMGTVFVFLTLLVIVMSVMARITRYLAPVTQETVSEEEVAAITAAVARHRGRQS